MTSETRFAEIAALAGDPARAAMLHALMDGRALSAGELATVAGISAQTASGHLARMLAAGLVTVEKQGRHRYHRLAHPSVARMLEGIMQAAADLAAVDVRTRRLSIGPREQALREARTCYDHIAGRLGVAIADALVARGSVELAEDGGVVTADGLAFLSGLGLDDAVLTAAGKGRSGRVVCRPCLDWSERRPHIAGRLGQLLCVASLTQGWVMRVDGSRALAVTPKGRRIFHRHFGFE